MGHAAIHTDEAKVYVNDKSIELQHWNIGCCLFLRVIKESL